MKIRPLKTRPHYTVFKTVMQSVMRFLMLHIKFSATLYLWLRSSIFYIIIRRMRHR